MVIGGLAFQFQLQNRSFVSEGEVEDWVRGREGAWGSGQQREGERVGGGGGRGRKRGRFPAVCQAVGAGICTTNVRVRFFLFCSFFFREEAEKVEQAGE